MATTKPGKPIPPQFVAASTAVRRQIIINIQGEAKTGKTDWVLRTAPEPVFHLVLDPNGARIHEKIKHELGRDMHMFQLGYSRGVERKTAVDLWAKLKEATEAALDYGSGTLLIDSGTEEYEIGRLATMGKLSGELAFNYQEVNSQLKDIYRSYYGSDLCVAVIHKLQNEWQGKSPTGNRVMSGWNDVGYEVQANVDTAYYHDNEEAKFWIYVRNNNLNMSTNNQWYGVDGGAFMTFEQFLDISVEGIPMS